MKLTQRTLFQCFEKSRSSTPSTNSSSNIQTSESQVKSVSQQQPQPDYVTSIHIRQLNNSLVSDTSHPCFTEKLYNDGNLSLPSEDFYRICPTRIVDNHNHLPHLEFVQITSIERQMELLEHYTKDEDFIDWRSMFEDFQEYRNKAIEQNQHEQLLWTEIYRPKSSKTYLGNHTRQIKRLNEWFAYWNEKINSEQPKRKNLPQKRKRIIDNDDECYEEDFSNDSSSLFGSGLMKSEHPQLIFIHGLGTTSLVHALAEEYNFKVTEINGSQSRARVPLFKQLEPVINHHHLSFKRCPSDTTATEDGRSTPVKRLLSPLPVKKKMKNERGSIMSYFSQNKKSTTLNDDQKENKDVQSELTLIPVQDKQSTILTNRTNHSTNNQTEEDSQCFSSVQVEKASLILFDEIETLTIDENFWSCLRKLLITAKKPIILTSNSRSNPEDAIINLSKIGYYELIHLQPNEPELVCCFLRIVLLNEMLDVPSSDDLIELFQFCSCDFRQTLITLQFLARSSNVNSLRKSSFQEKSPALLNPKWQSSHAFDAMYYSHLGEQWNESPLKIYFDDLTVKYTSEYQQSHLLLMTEIKNDAKRIELYDTFRLFMQEQEIGNIVDHPSFYLDYRPYVRQICQYEQARVNDSNSNRRSRHSLCFRGCSLEWSDFEILSAGID